MVPINISPKKFNHLANTLGCSKGSFPFTYLDLPLGITKPKVDDFLPLVSKCERRLACTSTFLSQAGKLELTNVVLSALPTFHMCTLSLPKGVIKQMDKFRKHYLWRGADINSKKPRKAAWEMVCVPKEEGGLGVIDLKKHNEALLVKNLDKFFNKKDLPWVSLVWEKHYNNGKLPSATKKGSFWWRDILKLLQPFKSFSIIHIQNGSTCLFWEDKWIQQTLENDYPELHSFAKNKVISVRDFYAQQHLPDLFNLPLSTEAYSQMQAVQSFLEHFPLIDEDDKWSSNWGEFSAARTYSFLIGHRDVHQAYKWL